MSLVLSTTKDPLKAVRRTDRPRVVTVDAGVLEAVVATDADASRRASRRTTVVSVDAAVSDLRADVRDAARAVLTWLAVVTDHRQADRPGRRGRQDGGLDRVLRRCVRPGMGLDGLDYTALADEVWRTTNIKLSPKRVQTAIRHLRQARTDLGGATTKPASHVLAGSDELVEALRAESTGKASEFERWTLATDVLAAVRSAVGRLITHDFAEGVEPGQTAEPELAKRFAEMADGGAWRQAVIEAIERHDGTAEADVRLVLAGASAVRRLAGAGSLVDTVAQLNVTVAGRDLIDTEAYVRRMLRVARVADRLTRDSAVKTELNRARRQESADHRLPSPTRVMSYALNNAATRLIDRLYLGEITPDRAGRAIRVAKACMDRMTRRDGGFQLIGVTRALLATVEAVATDDPGVALAFWRGVEADKAAGLLAYVARFDNCRPLVDAVFADARRVHPDAADGVIRV